MSQITELYGSYTPSAYIDWENVIQGELCPFLNRRCTKTRKSDPSITIGSCTISVGKVSKDVVICPNRLLERRQIFMDCIFLLTRHEPGNQLHVISEISVPGGNVDYFLVSARNGEIQDFVGIEMQALDTTGSIWPERQRFLQSKGLSIGEKDSDDASKTIICNCN